ncbi:MAG: hypothetical protein ACXWW6_04725, partial [Candidatus Limnocylindrales bacterium]
RLERVVEPGGAFLVVPAIAGEGRALYAAAAAQGIPAVVGRHRRSPYLPGVRSRLWRLVATSPSGAQPSVEDDAMSASPAAVPILALIQRLPLDPDD